MVLKSIAGLLEDFVEKTVPEELVSGELTVEEKLRALPVDEKAAKAFELKMSGLSNKAIAAGFGVSETTVSSWLRRHTEEFRKALESEPAANVIAQTLQFLDHLEEMCLYEANRLGDEPTRIDATTGKIMKERNAASKTLKLKYIQAASSIRMQKISMLTTVGVLPKQAEHLYHHMEDYKRIEDSPESRKERTKEQIANDVMELLKRARSI